MFLSLYRLAPRYQPKAKITTLLFQMARNACLNYLRHKPSVSLDAPEAPILRAPNDMIKEMMDDEQVEYIRAAIHDLPDAQKTAILLSEYELMSYDEIAHTMGTTVSAVKSLIHRGKEGLMKRLSKFVRE